MGDASEYFFHSSLSLVVDGSSELSEFTAATVKNVKDGLEW